MPWISPRTTSWKHHTRCLRDVWYFRKEIKRLAKKSEDEINFNANIWKWLWVWFDGLYKYRAANLPVMPNGFGEIGPPPSRISRNSQHWDAFIRFTSKKVFGLTMVPVYGNSQILMLKHCKGTRDQMNHLQFMRATEWQRYLDEGEILWCHHNKDWFYRGCFYNIFNLVGGKKLTSYIANPTIWECPVCRTSWIDASNNKFKNMHTRIYTCVDCKDKQPSNAPHTQSTIYGDYHSHYRTGWKFFPCAIPGDETVPLGIELEMQTKGSIGDFRPREDSWEMYQHQLAFNPKWNLFYCERDGSIGEYGLEMITQPMSQRLHNMFWEHMLPYIRTKFTGWNTQKKHPGGQYGIHITFDTKLFGQLNLARLAKFLENSQNKEFTQGLAQRGQLYGNNEQIAEKTKKVSDVFIYEHGKLLGSKQRNQILNLKNGKGLCEVRMFRSTLNTTSFFKNMEFLWAFHQWCGETPWNIKVGAFLGWLLDHPKLYTTYPHLYEYLCHEQFPVQPARWSTENAYAPAFIPLVEKLKKGQKDLFQRFSPENSDYNT